MYHQYLRTDQPYTTSCIKLINDLVVYHLQLHYVDFRIRFSQTSGRAIPTPRRRAARAERRRPRSATSWRARTRRRSAATSSPPSCSPTRTTSSSPPTRTAALRPKLRASSKEAPAPRGRGIGGSSNQGWTGHISRDFGYTFWPDQIRSLNVNEFAAGVAGTSCNKRWVIN